MKLNCDVGEGFDKLDEQIIPLVDQANIACGGHAGDQQTIHRCLNIAKRFATEVGAHPGYPDREGFGRRPMAISSKLLKHSLIEQCTTLFQIASELGVDVGYIKPHGALYNALSKDFTLFSLVIEVTVELKSRFNCSDLYLMVPAAILPPEAIEHAQRQQVPMLYEGFADRAYSLDGSLLSRQQPGSLLTESHRVLSRVDDLLKRRGVFTSDGTWLPLAIDSMCVHGDTPGAVEMVRCIRQRLSANDQG